MIAKTSLFALAKALEGIPILGALANTPASRAGIGYGDILLSVNGRRTKNVMDYVEAKALRTTGMDVVVFRSGSEKIEQLTYDEPGAHHDPAAILAELIALRIAPDSFDGESGGGSAPAA